MQPIALPFRPYCFPEPRFDCFSPPPELKAAVTFFWSLRSEAGGTVDLVPPEVETDIICRQGHPGSSFIRGPHRALSSVTLEASASFFGARLRPGAAQWLAARANSELVDQRVALPSVGDELAEICSHAASPASLLKGLSHLLVRALPARVRISESPQAAKALQLIENSRGQAPVREIARGFGWSDRHLRREIRAISGLSPKECARIYRFRRAMRLLLSPLPLASIAIDCAYTDQAHMTREFMRMTGLTPAALRRRMSASDKKDKVEAARDR